MNTRFRFTVVAPGRDEDGMVVRFSASDPKMNEREPFQLADGTMVEMVHDPAPWDAIA